jgi:hypothetical protein
LSDFGEPGVSGEPVDSGEDIDIGNSCETDNSDDAAALVILIFLAILVNLSLCTF